MLAVQDIYKRYRSGTTDLEVLQGISLEVAYGELLSIIGPSGCGKSTLMHILGLLDRPSAGKVIFDGITVDYENDRQLSTHRNRMIGFVFQQYNLLPRLNAVANVMAPLVYRGLEQGEMQERAMTMLRLVGMEGRAYHKPSELSGGQQQRVAIARALVGDPLLILADEPTGALDQRVGQEVMDLFLSLNADKGIACVIVTHNPQIAQQCRRVIELSDGMVA